ncbi:acyltransferase family protein [Aquabacterium sp.]|uniref:acyltransferase family protein n=1 Tax=Aquabacterium sp. TaxID=1872578 RepID=UPI00378387C9
MVQAAEGRALASNAPAHNDNFVFLRTSAALLVLVSHQHALTGRPEPSFIGIQSWGGLGVMMFFSISGFLVTQSWLADPHAGRFAARRLLRIWPGFAVVILLAALVLGPCLSPLPWTDYLQHPRLLEYLNNLVFRLRDALPLQFDGSALPRAVNGSLWTIPLELQCYLALALAAFGGWLGARRCLATVVAGLAWAYAGWDLRGQHVLAGLGLSVEQSYLVEFGLCFFTGSVLWLYWPQWRDRRAVLLLLSLAVAACAFLLGRPVLAGLIGVPIVTIVFGSWSWPVLRRFDALGDLSYGIYLYAFPIQQTVIALLTQRLHWWPRLLLVLVCTLACAWLSWRLVERPALRWKPRTRRQARPASPPLTSDAMPALHP